MAELIKPYGDTLNDGVIQLTFTLPVENSARGRKAAEQYVGQLNCEQVSVAHATQIAEGFTYFVVFARAIPSLDYEIVQASEVEVRPLDFTQINALIKERLLRKLIVVGATVGSDAHTVGIDAIMNMKGYNHDYGLERYPQIEAHNLGAQIPCETLVEQALAKTADAILVSQTVTQKDAHIRNFTELIELLEAENLRSRFTLVAGGPRIGNDLALELGYDAGFGPDTRPSQVAAFLISHLLNRQGA